MGTGDVWRDECPKLGRRAALPDRDCLYSFQLNFAVPPQHNKAGAVVFILVVDLLAIAQNDPQGSSALEMGMRSLQRVSAFRAGVDWLRRNQTES